MNQDNAVAEAAWLSVLAERKRQIEKEDWTPEHDDEHQYGDLARAAACYALGHRVKEYRIYSGAEFSTDVWPWDADSWKPKSPRENLVRAGALILAEIERLDRAQAQRVDEGGVS